MQPTQRGWDCTSPRGVRLRKCPGTEVEAMYRRDKERVVKLIESSSRSLFMPICLRCKGRVIKGVHQRAHEDVRSIWLDRCFVQPNGRGMRTIVKLNERKVSLVSRYKRSVYLDFRALRRSCDVLNGNRTS